MEHANNNVGLVQWFQVNQRREVERALEDFQRLGITRIRTNVSWADWHLPDGKAWYDWLFSTLSKKLEILPCVFYTPAFAANKTPVQASSDPQAYAGFVQSVITAYGSYFEYLELFNEPNNFAEYDFTRDTDWNLFGEMLSAASAVCKENGKRAVLGGMRPVDPNWLDQMFRKGVMEHIDVVGIHGFPGVYDSNWEGWPAEIAKVRNVLRRHSSSAQLWISAAGFSTWQKNERRQLQEFIEARTAAADRMYWYCLEDLSGEPATAGGLNLDEREHFFGMKHADGSSKLLYTMLCDKGVKEVSKYKWMARPTLPAAADEKYTLITGGAGFVGTNLADRLLSQGESVLILDNLSRAGVQNNLFWLKEKHPDKLRVMIADIRDKEAVKQAVANASHVFHFAAQVAVTSSLTNPYHDFEVNALGTLNLLEAIRQTKHQPPIIFTSTNKVYGDLHDLGMVMNQTRYYPENTFYKENGIGEERNLDFHSPYGCTKGVADQYILDYARTFGLKSAVFRMSCIYGPHQFGTEDQGWVAHFLIQAIKNKPITLYGDGKQVRDILFVDDLVNAFVLARENMNQITGQAFNIGGGVNNTVSLLELIQMIGLISGETPGVQLEDWRSSDQKYYVSDYNKFKTATGWMPQVNTMEGVEKLYEWLLANANRPAGSKLSRSDVKTNQSVF